MNAPGGRVVGLRHRSPDAARELLAAIEEGMTPFDEEVEDAMGATDCPGGCQVEPDGTCSHGYESAAITLGVI